MKFIEKVLLPVDIDKDVQKQLSTAQFLSDNFNTEIIFLYVSPIEGEKESIRPLIEKFVTNEFEALRGQLSNNVKVDFRIEYGNTFERILYVAEKEKVNAIVVLQEDSKQNEKIETSITIEKLVRKCQRPVWIVKSSSDIPAKKILCPIDCSDASKRALNNAVKIARKIGAKIFLLNIYQPLEENFSPRLSIDFEKENKKLLKENKERLQKFLDDINFVDVDFKVVELVGVPENMIVTFAYDHHIDLIFMGTTGKGYFERMLMGSVSEKVMQKLPCSLITTKSENILNLKLSSDITQIEKIYRGAQELEKTGYFDEAIEEYKKCINVSDMHIPALSALYQLYGRLGDNENAEFFKLKLDEILRKLWDRKIEFEIRKYYKL